MTSTPIYGAGPSARVNGGFGTISNSSDYFNILDASVMNVRENLLVCGNMNGKLAETTVTLYTPVTFSNASGTTQYVLNSSRNGLANDPNLIWYLPDKAIITEATIIANNISYDLALDTPSKQQKTKILMGWTSRSSDIINEEYLNAPRAIFQNADLYYAQPEHGGGIAVGGGNSDPRYNIGATGSRGMVTDGAVPHNSPIALQLTNSCVGATDQILNNGELIVTITYKIVP